MPSNLRCKQSFGLSKTLTNNERFGRFESATGVGHSAINARNARCSVQLVERYYGLLLPACEQNVRRTTITALPFSTSRSLHSNAVAKQEPQRLRLNSPASLTHLESICVNSTCLVTATDTAWNVAGHRSTFKVTQKSLQKSFTHKAEDCQTVDPSDCCTRKGCLVKVSDSKCASVYATCCS